MLTTAETPTADNTAKASSVPPAEQVMIDAAIAMKPRVAELAAEIDTEGKLPDELVDRMRESGFFKMNIPTDLGGSQVSIATFARVVEEISSADGSAGWCVCFPAVNGIAAASMPTQGAREIFGPESAYVAGTGAPANRGAQAKAYETDRGFRVTGRWSYASGCLHATWLFTTCDLFDDDRPIINDRGIPVRRFFYFPVEDCQIIDNWNVSGMRGSGSHDFAVDDVFVPAHRTVLASDEIVPNYDDPIYRFSSGKVPHGTHHSSWVGHASVGLAAVCLGMAKGALDDLVALSQTKIDRGGKALLKDNSVFQDSLGRVSAKLRAARGYLSNEMQDSLRDTDDNSVDQEGRLLMLRVAGTHASLMAGEVMETVAELAGTASIRNDSPFERRSRDMRAALSNRVLGPEHYGDAARYLLESKS